MVILGTVILASLILVVGQGEEVIPIDLVVGQPAPQTLTADEARIFETMAGSVTHEIMMERPELRKKIGREWTRERYKNHKSDRENRFVQSKIDVLVERMAERGFNHLIVAGSPKMVSRFTNALPPRLREMLVDTLNVNPNAGISPIILEAIEAFVANEHRESQDRVGCLVFRMILGR